MLFSVRGYPAVVAVVVAIKKPRAAKLTGGRLEN
jgi:hypothetical protein